MTSQHDRSELPARQRPANSANARHGRLRILKWVAGLAVAAAITTMLITSQSTSATVSSPATDFTLPTTAGGTVTLSQLRGQPVLLYFNEGAGCAACIVQMGEIEQRKAEFDAIGVTVLPIVMNTRAEISADLARSGVTTPFLLDDGTISEAYGTLGKGMHSDLPGHSFILIDAAGRQRWYGEFPSMWLDPADLLAEVRTRLDAGGQ